MAAKGEIKIDQKKCKGCELCLASCPTEDIILSLDVNAKGYHFATTKNVKCTACMNCAIMCPEGIISVYRFVKQE